MFDFLVYNEFVGFVVVRVEAHNITRARKHISIIYGNKFVKLPFLFKNNSKIICEKA